MLGLEVNMRDKNKHHLFFIEQVCGSEASFNANPSIKWGNEQGFATKKYYRHHNSQGCTLEPRPASKWHERRSLADTSFISNGLKRIWICMSIATNTHILTSQYANIVIEHFRWAMEGVFGAVIESGFIGQRRLVS